MTTYDENGGYPHPDHIMCHKIAMHAFDAAADPSAYPDAGARGRCRRSTTTRPSPRRARRRCTRRCSAAGLESPYGEWLERWEDREERPITAQVPCGEYFEVRDRALLAHATQVDPDGAWFHCPLDLQRDGLADRGLRAARQGGDRGAPARGRPVRRGPRAQLAASSSRAMTW